MNQKTSLEWLPFYLRDHLAGAKAGVKLFARVAQGHSHQRVRNRVATIRDEVVQDCQALGAIMEDLDVRQVSLPMVVAVLGERVGRLKPNGSLITRSTGADVLELEALVAAVEAKSQLWDTLLVLANSISELDAQKLGHLRDRASAQRGTLIELHTQAVRTTISG